MEENQYQYQFQPQTPPNAKKAAMWVNIINAIGLGIMLLLCLPEDGGFIAFILGCLLACYNFISMIIQFVNKNTMAAVFNIIWMLLMPIIGFGCCAATINFHG
jgi:hypothetical protein